MGRFDRQVAKRDAGRRLKHARLDANGAARIERLLNLATVGPFGGARTVILGGLLMWTMYKNGRVPLSGSFSLSPSSKTIETKNFLSYLFSFPFIFSLFPFSRLGLVGFPSSTCVFESTSICLIRTSIHSLNDYSTTSFFSNSANLYKQQVLASSRAGLIIPRFHPRPLLSRSTPSTSRFAPLEAPPDLVFL